MRLLLLLVVLVVCGPAAPASADGWRWPLDGEPSVSRPFAAPAHRYAAGHRGADLVGTPGAPVRAAEDGWVSYAGLVAGRGVVVVVHGPLRTTYEPVSALVDVGAVVAAGEVVGVLEPGHLGCPVPACLHWGLRRGDDYLDPVRLVAPGPVRLLPVEGPPPVVALRAAGDPAGPVAAAAHVDGTTRPALRVADGTAPALAHGAAAAPGRRPPDPAVAAAASMLAAASAVAVTAARRRR